MIKMVDMVSSDDTDENLKPMKIYLINQNYV